MTPEEEKSKRDLVDVLRRCGALLTGGDYKLKSGRISPYFVDFGQIPDGEGLSDLGRCYAEKIVREFDEQAYDVVFGPAYKAIPIAVATVMALAQEYGLNKRYAFDRKAEKSYGERSRFIGDRLNRPGTRVLVIDDVFTDGGTKVDTIKLVEAVEGVKVVGVVVGVDRSENAEVVKSFEQLTKLRLTSLCTIDDIDAVVRQQRVAA
ncbi:MAG: orotate phosphoribosyltransferase [Solirubrobacteraceae bacterium]